MSTSSLTFFRNPSNAVAVSWDGTQIVLPTGRVLLAEAVPVWREVDEDLTDSLGETQMEVLLAEIEKDEERDAQRTILENARKEEEVRRLAWEKSQEGVRRAEADRRFARDLRSLIRLLHRSGVRL